MTIRRQDEVRRRFARHSCGLGCIVVPDGRVVSSGLQPRILDGNDSAKGNAA